MHCITSVTSRLPRAGLGLLGAAVIAAVPVTTANAQAERNPILDEIVVTAQRREENILEVPISVTALNGERVDVFTAGGEDIRALAARVPSLYAESSNGRLAPRFYMRGLGNSDFDLAASQSVSILFDEVVQENVILKSFPIFDIDRVEVLRGPQGTLFGRNTPAGIIKFESRRPTEDLNGYVFATLGSLGTKNVEFALGGGLNESDTLMGRISFLSQNREDWIDNGFTGEDEAMGGFSENAFRAQLLWQPTDSLGALFNIHGRDLSSGTASIFRANVLSPGSNDLNDNFDRDRVFFDAGNNNPQEANAWGSSLRLDFDFGNQMTLTSISAYETVENSSWGDIDGGFGAVFLPGPSGPGLIPFPSETRDGLTDLEQITQEFRLASEASDQLFWQAGVFWFDSDFSVQTFPFFVDPTTVRHENTAWAAFGQVAYDLTDAMTLTAGLRYTDDEKDMSVPATVSPHPNLPAEMQPPPGGTSAPVSVSDEQVSWDISLMYALNDGWNVYGRVANGFRAPSIQGRNVAFPNFDNPDAEVFSIADSETILSTEIGFKSVLGDRVRLNGAVYYYTIDDMQLSAIGGAANSNILINAEEGTGTGVDIDTEILLTDNLVVTFGGSWNDTEIEDSGLRTAVCAQCTVLDPIDTDGFALLDGNPFPQAPEHMINATARYTLPVNADDEYYVLADYVQQGDTNFFLYESVEFHTGTIYEIGLRAGYVANGGQWELSVFARNLTDEENLKGGIDFNNLTGFVNEPRIFGVNFRMNFGDY